ncbi:glycosyltransferase family 4 protein [Candidatus Nitrospira neomarina]|uniref:Glycosyltransferase family 4 protein n=1 Tax=Candidatus Nitrospira neomarina TaxID=3020899 RepID=A0AA96GFN3_9BACT|nr:glycosyltransferase family 4 protein [Candidatus Nitrospira neomarina]WNM60277.1 glycosyltransferase family 4 protein [Candidatus Nitrospira neomarina]
MRPIEGLPRFLFVDTQVDDFLMYRMGLARKVQEAGFEVHVALPREPGMETISRVGIIVHPIFMRRLSMGAFDELRCLISLLRLYRRLRPTLVHHMCLKAVLYGGIASRVVGVPAVVSTLYGLGYLFSTQTVKTYVLRSIVMVGLRFAFGHKNHRVIVQNSADRDWLLSKYNLACEVAVLISGSGVDLSLFKPKPEPDGPPVVLLVSRLLWIKGISEFVAAARAVRARKIPARFVLIGEPDNGHPSAIPVRTLEHWRDTEDVDWLGFRHDLPVLIGQSHIVCLPTIYGEGVPRILQEAAACGRPIVASDIPGCREIVRHGQNGMLVPVGDLNGLIGALVQLIENAPLRATMGTRGYALAVAEFSLEKVIDLNLAVYNSLLS